MSELHYGKNVEWFLEELAAIDSNDIDSAEFEVYAEDPDGNEGSATIDLTILAGDAVKIIADLQQKLDAVVAENAALKSAFNPEVIPEEAVEAFTETAIMDHDWNDTGEWSWVENDTDVIRAVLEAIKPETPATDAMLNALRAEGVELFANATISIGEAENDDSIVYAGHQALLFANQLRTNATKGGSDDKR